MDDEPAEVPEVRDFSLVLGGPMYDFFVSAHLVQAPLGWLNRRIIACSLLAWLPLAFLTLIAGTFVSGVKVPFIYDLSNLRFVIVLPILLAAELVVHRRMQDVVAQFYDRDLIAPADKQRFKEIISGAMQLRNSGVIEALLAVIAFTGGYWVWLKFATLPIDTWYANTVNGSMQFTVAGYWLAFISLPLARFIALRWYFRLLIWYQFLWKVSYLKLKLDPLHPDKAGGLGFLDESVIGFMPVLVAHSIFLSAMIGNEIWHTGKSLPEFQLEIIGFVLGLIIVVLLPQTFFVYQMFEAKFNASRKFGQLSIRYTGQFWQKWLRNELPHDQQLLGSPDIQALAALSNSFEVVDQMRVTPFDKGVILKLAILIGIPLLPLPLTMVPINVIVEHLIGFLI